MSKVIIIGGGIAGTSAAYHLSKRGYEVTIIEKNDYLGGRVRSRLIDGIALEYGAEFISNMYPNLLGFLKEHELERCLRLYRPSAGIVHERVIHLASLITAVNRSLLSRGAMAQFLSLFARILWQWGDMDPGRPWKLARYDSASIADHYRSRSGKEFFERVVQPALTATFFWLPQDVQDTSEAVLLFYGKALLKGGIRKLCCGLQRIPEAAAQGSIVLLGHKVTRVERSPNGMYAVFFDTGGTQKTLEAAGIVCATTASVVSKLFPDLAEYQKSFFQSIRYSSASYVGRIYKRKDVRGDSSVAYTVANNTAVAGVTATCNLDTEMMEPKVAVVKVSSASKLYEQGEENATNTLIEGARPATDALLIGNPAALHTYSWHWEEALPTLTVGYFKRLKDFLEKENASTEPLVFAGDYLGGPFMEGAFASGLRAAMQLDRKLRDRVDPAMRGAPWSDRSR